MFFSYVTYTKSSLLAIPFPLNTDGDTPIQTTL